VEGTNKTKTMRYREYHVRYLIKNYAESKSDSRGIANYGHTYTSWNQAVGWDP
jgi:hypothetical protein